jgi:hypothetical protein
MKKVALLAGIKDYENNHQAPINGDIFVDQLEGVLMDHYNYVESDVHVLKNEDFTWANLLLKLLQIAESLKENDQLVIYLNTHGGYNNDKYELATYHQHEGFSRELFLFVIKFFKANVSIHILLDICQSGSIFDFQTGDQPCLSKFDINNLLYVIEETNPALKDAITNLLVQHENFPITAKVGVVSAVDQDTLAMSGWFMGGLDKIFERNITNNSNFDISYNKLLKNIAFYYNNTIWPEKFKLWRDEIIDQFNDDNFVLDILSRNGLSLSKGDLKNVDSFVATLENMNPSYSTQKNLLKELNQIIEEEFKVDKALFISRISYLINGGKITLKPMPLAEFYGNKGTGEDLKSRKIFYK